MNIQKIYERINQYKPKDLSDLSAEEYKEGFLQNAKEEGFVQGIRNQMHTYLSEEVRNRVAISDTKKVLEEFEKISADNPELTKEIEDFAERFVAPIDMENPVTHPNADEIEKLKAQTPSEQQKSDLDYINQNVLIGHDTDFLNVFMKLGENYPSRSGKEQIQSAIPEMQKDDAFKNHVTYSDGEFDYKDYDNEEFYRKMGETDLSYSEESKKKIIDVLTTLDNMKDMDGAPLFKPEKYVRDEGANKEYAFKNIADCTRAASDALKAGDTEKLSKIAAFHKESIKQYDALLAKVKDLNMPHIPGNLSFARNGTMPDKYLKDIKGVSQLNGFWGILATIKKGGSTIEDFVNGPRKTYEKSIANVKDFKPFNDLGHKVGDLEFLKTMANGKYDAIKDQAMYASYGQRYFFAASMLDPATSAKNRGLANLFLGTSASELGKKYRGFGASFLGTDKIQTYKNVLINTDPEKDYTRLSSNPDMPLCPLSGEKPKSFDYQNYLEKGNIDFTKLAQNLEENKEKLAGDPSFRTEKADLEKAIAGVAFDLVKTNRLDNDKVFDRFAAISGKSMSEIYQARSGKEAFSQYMMNEYRALNGEKLNHEKINTTLNVLKGLSEKYNSRNIFSKYLTPGGWAERKALNEMKTDMTKNGVDVKQIDSFLTGKTGKEEFARNLPKEEPVKDAKNAPEAQNEDRVRIHIPEFDDKTKNVAKEKSAPAAPQMTKNTEKRL